MKFLNLFQYFILTEMSDLRPDGMLCTVLDQKSDELVFKSCSETLDINAKLWSYEMVYTCTLFYALVTHSRITSPVLLRIKSHG